MAIELLDELIVQILSFLPANSLLRCRLVCKSWLNLISSTKFRLMHFHNFNQLNPRYFIRRLDYLVSEEWFSVHFDDGAFTLDGSTDFEFCFKITGVNLWFRIIGCCNGVVCLSDEDEGCSFVSDRVILWNPSIRRKLTLTLPIFKSINFVEVFVVLGFGYDKISDDYKVVRLFYTHYYSARPPRVEVYTVKTGIWREVMFPDDLRCLFVHYNGTQVFSNGSVHWIAYDPTPWVLLHNSILTFDTSSELFGEIQLPDDLVKALATTVTISVVGEYLAVTYYNDLVNNIIIGATRSHKVWVMKEYKNPDSWTLVYDMHIPDIDMERPLQVRNNGNVSVRNYCARSSLFYSGYESEMDCWTYVDKYQESLALLDVGHSVPNKETDERSNDD